MFHMRRAHARRCTVVLLVASFGVGCSSSSPTGPKDASPDSPSGAFDGHGADASAGARDGAAPGDGGRSLDAATDGMLVDGAGAPPRDGAAEASLEDGADPQPEAEAGPELACAAGDVLCADGGVILCGAGGEWDGGASICPSGTACSGNRCSAVLIADAGGAVNDLVLDHDNLFWVTGWMPPLSGTYPYPPDAGSVMVAPIDGGPPREIGTVVAGAGFTAVDGTAYASQTSTDQIVAFPSDGGASRVFVDAGSSPFSLATDGTSLFWCRNVAFTPIYSAPLAGGATTSFGGAQDGVVDLAVANGNVFWGTYTGTNAIVGIASTDGSNARTLASTLDTDLWLAGDGVNVYWVGWGGSSGDIWQVSVDGGTPLNLASGQGGPYGIAADGTSVFWTTGGSVLKEPVSGGHISVIAAAQPGAGSLVVDSTYVYWAAGDGTIARAPK